MTRTVITTTEFTDFAKAEEILQKYKIEKLPVVDKSNKLVGLITYKDIIKIKARPNACKDNRGRLRVAAAVGVASDTMDRVAVLVREGVDAIVIDTAHGHSKLVMEMARRVKKEFPEIDLIAGNIGTAQAAKDFTKIGVDGLKVGIGPGSICTTRIIAGIGIPQLSAIYDVTQDSHNTQEQCPGQSDTALHLCQVFLGGRPPVHARDLRTGFLQILTIILLGEHYIGIKECKANDHQKIQQIINPATITRSPKPNDFPSRLIAMNGAGRCCGRRPRNCPHAAATSHPLLHRTVTFM